MLFSLSLTVHPNSIRPTLLQEDEILFCRTLYGVMRNISHLCTRKNSRTWGQDAWKKVSGFISRLLTPHWLDLLQGRCLYRCRWSQESTPARTWLSHSLGCISTRTTHDQPDRRKTCDGALIRVYDFIRSWPKPTLQIPRQRDRAHPDTVLYEREEPKEDQQSPMVLQCIFTYATGEAWGILSHLWYTKQTYSPTYASFWMSGRVRGTRVYTTYGKRSICTRT